MAKTKKTARDRASKQPLPKKPRGKAKTEGDDAAPAVNTMERDKFCALMDPQNYNPDVFNVFRSHDTPIMVKDHKGHSVPIMPLDQHCVCPFCFYRDGVEPEDAAGETAQFEATHSYKYSSLTAERHHKSNLPKGQKGQPVSCYVTRIQWLQGMYEAGKIDMLTSKEASFVKKAYKMTDEGKVDGKVVLTKEAYNAILRGVSELHRWRS